MNVLEDRIAEFMAYFSLTETFYSQDLQVQADGSFTVGLPNGLAGPSARSVGPRVVGALSGTISGGQVTGSSSGIAFSGAVDPAGGPDSAVAGYYKASALYSGGETTYAMVGPSGETLAVVVNASTADAATGTTSASGQFTATTSSGSTLSLSVDGQSLSGSVTPAGSSSPIPFSGLSGNVAAASRLVNLSVRGNVGTGPNILIAGFVTGGGTKTILVRGVGPTLASFNVTGTLAAPQLTLLGSEGGAIGTNSAWGGSASLSRTFSQVGAFALAAASADSALVESLPPGSYTAQLAGSSGAGGIGLAEVYDADSGFPAGHLTNISARGQVGTGGNVLIAGFAISGNAPVTVLLRGIGPSLSQFGLAGVLAAPQITLFDSGGAKIDSNTALGGSPALAGLFTQAGAFALPSGSADSALQENLPPGVYTVELSGVSGATGLALIEVYEVP